MEVIEDSLRPMGPQADYSHFKELWDEIMTPPRDDCRASKTPSASGRSSKGRKRKRSFSGEGDEGGLIENMEFVSDDRRREGGSTVGDSSRPRSIARDDGAEKQHEDPGPGDGELLYRHCSIAEVDNLVGWATSHHGNVSDSATSTSMADERRLGLCHLPMAPPPPSHVAFLSRRIKERLGGHSSSPVVSAFAVKGENCTAAVQMGEGVEISPSLSNVAMAMDTSAHVAVAMAAEEALTAELLPLAQAHVRRCRRLERKGKGRKPGQAPVKGFADGTDPFHAWTLPPGEAIAILARDGSDDALLSSFADGRSETGWA
ncbi:hypothetical protein ACHAWF_014916 [Thalassiosira exigua]